MFEIDDKTINNEKYTIEDYNLYIKESEDNLERHVDKYPYTTIKYESEIMKNDELDKHILISPLVRKFTTFENDRIIILCAEKNEMYSLFDELLNINSLSFEDALDLLNYSLLINTKYFYIYMKRNYPIIIREYWEELNNKFIPFLIKRFYDFDDETTSKVIFEILNEKRTGNNLDKNNFWKDIKKLQKKEQLKNVKNITDDVTSIQRQLYQFKDLYKKIVNDDDKKSVKSVLETITKITNDYFSKGFLFPSTFEIIKYIPVSEDENINNNINPRYVLRKQYIELSKVVNNNVLLCSRELCDMILKSKLDYDIKYIKYAIFFLYLEECFVRTNTKKTSRFLFKIKDVTNILNRICKTTGISKTREEYKIFKRNLRYFIYCIPFIPRKDNFYNESYKVKPTVFLREYPFKKLEVITEFKNKLSFFSDYILNDGFLWKYKNMCANLNGSLIQAVLKSESMFFGDIDIRIDYMDNENYVSDEDFDSYINEIYKRYEYKIINFEKVALSNKEKYKYKMNIKCERLIYISYVPIEFYRGSFGIISNYHVSCVRANWDGEELLMYPSFVVSMLTDINLDLRYFSTEKNDKMSLVEKYVNRNYIFILNNYELTLLYEYKIKKYSSVINLVNKYFKRIRGDNPTKILYEYIKQKATNVIYESESIKGYIKCYEEDKNKLEDEEDIKEEFKEMMMYRIEEKAIEEYKYNSIIIYNFDYDFKKKICKHFGNNIICYDSKGKPVKEYNSYGEIIRIYRKTHENEQIYKYVYKLSDEIIKRLVEPSTLLETNFINDLKEKAETANDFELIEFYEKIIPAILYVFRTSVRSNVKTIGGETTSNLENPFNFIYPI